MYHRSSKNLTPMTMDKLQPSDDLPQAACGKCFSGLKSAIELKRLCLESDSKLKNICKMHRLETDRNPSTIEQVPVIHYKIIYEDVLEASVQEYENTDSILREELPQELSESPRMETEHIIEEREDVSGDPVMCCGCGESFPRKDNLLAHSKLIHKPQQTISEERAFECEICYKRYTSTRGLKLHQKNIYQMKHFQCSVCGKRFSNKVVLLDHERIHTKEKPFCCSYCGRSFGSKSNLQSHRRLHFEKSDNTKHVCNFCGKDFSRKGYLKHHYSVAHNDDTPFSCSLCPGKFKAKANLKLHLRTHTQERPYSCDLCAKRFMYPTDKKRHMIQHTGQKPFKCPECAKAFMRKGQLQKHQAIHVVMDVVDDSFRT
ncbi:gastrula zinc finger protein XlCGF8.2DB-like isoform X2 [Uranotaenia lowii]|uniref:gastrula zinc finger protein XlCGF8.2DB-like isoform X2 n=1 Tax=Uranotaenia lowii TaxID=190385 RepID=UPI00247B2A92|nr:gastrula zinc finger protein XlCGF8.2DB-like isoform X2 [Uranotaenia lowii]